MTSTEHKGLSPKAYEVMHGDQYDPYVPSTTKMAEFTPIAVILGAIQGIIFAMAMVYVGLKVGMTVSASIPAAVISMGILKGIFRRGTILENNIVQTVASSGVSMASGIIFTLPAAFLWPEFTGDVAARFSVGKLTLMAAMGGTLGALMMIPLRKYLIVEEHGKLKYPEGTACAEVLVAGEVGGNPARLVFSGIGLGAAFKFMQSAMNLWKGEVSVKLPLMKNLVLSGEVSPILLGVGYIIGLEVSAYMLAGGLLAWFVLIPFITYFGSGLAAPLAPAKMLISTMDADMVWKEYIRYIGAGAVAMGGLISLSKSMPTILGSFKTALRELIADFKKGAGAGGREVERIKQDIPMPWIIGLSVALVVVMALSGIISSHFLMGVLGAMLVFVFGFFFVTVSSRIVGLVGSSSNPVSGMTIGTLILSTIIFHSLGFKGIEGMVTSLMVGTLICLAMCLSGDASQDLKTGFLLGGTPKWMQIGQIVGIGATSYFVVNTTIMLKDLIVKGDLVAPQANLMALIIRGIMEANLPWELVIGGAFVAVCVELLGIPALPVAVGFYLPLSLSTPIMVGGLLAYLASRLYKGEEFKKRNEYGILVASGLIAGDAIIGLGVIGLNYCNMDLTVKWAGSQWQWLAILTFLLVAAFLWYFVSRGDSGKNGEPPEGPPGGGGGGSHKEKYGKGGTYSAGGPSLAQVAVGECIPRCSDRPEEGGMYSAGGPSLAQVAVGECIPRCDKPEEEEVNKEHKEEENKDV